MAALIESSLWIDFMRARSPRALKQFIAPYILAPDSSVAEPIVFEVLRHASAAEIRPIQAQFATMPSLMTPADLWKSATTLGQACRARGIVAGSQDLLIVTIAVHHDAELVTFDADFQLIARACKLRLTLLKRPG